MSPLEPTGIVALLPHRTLAALKICYATARGRLARFAAWSFPARSHDELRGALLLAGKHIRKLSFGRKDDRAVRKAARPVRLRIPLGRS